MSLPVRPSIMTEQKACLQQNWSSLRNRGLDKESRGELKELSKPHLMPPLHIKQLCLCTLWVATSSDMDWLWAQRPTVDNNSAVLVELCCHHVSWIWKCMQGGCWSQTMSVKYYIYWSNTNVPLRALALNRIWHHLVGDWEMLQGPVMVWIGMGQHFAIFQFILWVW